MNIKGSNEFLMLCCCLGPQRLPTDRIRTKSLPMHVSPLHGYLMKPLYRGKYFTFYYLTKYCRKPPLRCVGQNRVKYYDAESGVKWVKNQFYTSIFRFTMIPTGLFLNIPVYDINLKLSPVYCIIIAFNFMQSRLWTLAFI